MTVDPTNGSTTVEPADGELLTRYRSGDLDSFRQLYDRHKAPLFLYVLGITRDQGTAEDILQEAFLRLLDETRVPVPDSARAYLFTMARRLAIDKRRRTSAEWRMRGNLLGGGPTEGSAGSEVAERVSEALRALPDEQREAVLLKVYAGFTYAEISRLTALPLGTVMSRYRYALEKMGALLQQE